MTDFKQNEITQNFLFVFKQLKGKRFKNNVDFARVIEYTPQTINDIVQGRRDVSIEILNRLFVKYDVPLNAIFKNSLYEKNHRTEENEELGNNLINLRFNNVRDTFKSLNRCYKAYDKLGIRIPNDSFPVSWINNHKEYDLFEDALLSAMREQKIELYADLYDKLNVFYKTFLNEYMALTNALSDLIINPSKKIDLINFSDFKPEEITSKVREIKSKTK